MYFRIHVYTCIYIGCTFYVEEKANCKVRYHITQVTHLFVVTRLCQQPSNVQPGDSSAAQGLALFHSGRWHTGERPVCFAQRAAHQHCCMLRTGAHSLLPVECCPAKPRTTLRHFSKPKERTGHDTVLRRSDKMLDRLTRRFRKAECSF